MASKTKSGKPGPLLAIRSLAVVGLGLSGYLAYASLNGSGVAGCGPASGCEKVLASRWGYWMGVPVSLPALALYLATLIVAIRLTPSSIAPQRRKLWRFLLLAAMVISLGAIYFTVLQKFVLGSFCPFCMMTHAVGFALALLIFFNAPYGPQPEKEWRLEKSVFLTPAQVQRVVFVALTGIGVLIAGQVVLPHKTFVSTDISDNLDNNAPTPPSLAPLSTSTNPTSIRYSSLANVPRPTVSTNGRKFEIYEGRFAFDLNEVPLVGSPTASNAMVSLYDYTCSHCRLMHTHLLEAQAALGDKLAIVSLPMPFDRECNYTVTNTPPEHADACGYARLGLAVWHANRNAFREFDNLMFAPEKPLPLNIASQFAESIVGREAVLRATKDGWVDQYLKLGIDIYATNYFHVKQGSMPQLIIGKRLTAGTMDSVADLYKVLEEQLGIKP